MACACCVACPGDIDIFYEWPAGQSDLDTATEFLSGTVGYSCSGETTYLKFPSGDVQGNGPKSEQVTIKAALALADGQWSGSVTADLHAGWFNGGSGDITIRVRCAGDATTDRTETVTPGGTHPCSTSPPSHHVATLTINANGTFSLNPLP
jgi:hypothetical protein